VTILRAFRSALDSDPIPSDTIVYAVVVDVLRMSTTLVQAFAHGARSARAFATIAEARAFAGSPDARVEHGVLLCGESGGLRPEGFDRGNSPREFADVRGKDLVIATTNGAVAIARTAGAKHQFLAAFVNLTAAADALAAIARRNVSEAPELWLVAAGKAGLPAAEDDALVGALAARLLVGGSEIELAGEDPRARCEAAGFDSSSGRLRADGDLEAFLRETEHGRALVELGFAADVHAAAQIDTLTRLPFGRGGTIGPGLDRAQATDIPLF
jgi:2-phosphosulfolactate phosphatase